MRNSILCFLLALIVRCGGLAAAQEQGINPVDLVRRATENEIAATGQTRPPYFMYKDTTVYRDRSITKEEIETSQGGLERVIAKNGKPLSADEQAKADQKLKAFAYNPDARRKKLQSNREDDQRAVTLMRSLPDAFTYTVAGVSKTPKGHELVHLKFKAKPDWSAPTRETRVLEGMQGDMVIDRTAMRLAEINGELFEDVDFGWGILGRLEQGGKFIIKQAEVGEGKWQQIEETLRFNGKILMVKNLNIWSTETMTDFRPVPSDVTTAQALQLLGKSDEVVAENGGGTAEKHK